MAGVPGLGVMTTARSSEVWEAPLKSDISALSLPSMVSASGTKVGLVRRRATSRKSRPESPKNLRISSTRPRRWVPERVPTRGMVKPRTGRVGSILSDSRSSVVSVVERSTMAGRRMSGLSMPYFWMAWS